MRALVVIAALLALVAGGCGGAGEEAMPPMETAPPAESSGRPRAAPISGTTLDGEEISLADFRGRAVLVNVWASW